MRSARLPRQIYPGRNDPREHSLRKALPEAALPALAAPDDILVAAGGGRHAIPLLALRRRIG